MPFTNRFKTALLKYQFQNVALAGIGDAAGLQPSASAGNFYISLHTILLTTSAYLADQSTNEVSLANYPTYARQPVPRDLVSWDVFENRAMSLVDVLFPACVGGTSPTVKYFGIGLEPSGPGRLCYYGVIGPGDGLVITPGLSPKIPANLLAVYIG